MSDTVRLPPILPPKPRGPKASLLRIDQLDGRTTTARNVRALLNSITSDLGGHDALSEAQRILVQRAAVLSAVCEDFEMAYLSGQKADMQSYNATVNVLRRVLDTLGLERKAKDLVDLQTYIKG
ncbi:hypothetical protein [Phyllobacterium endophyticum]|uniref:Uncharacterized protein n=1 Tax=Phyllobacterium endophyticum TaxID=1149773 RepID=A0A2P7AUW5_9HYPH|nr:hypothetical protein [Phyllobacterium endophyticum]MBB3234529.1 DNA-binding phage protein [Phyllobacterium endophyticum]PSH58014.1 hypothetical protein CU100_10125 [Phyllobacterium endophyticum]TYR38682.1 hypothetical protein FY050_22085 [Phyllobacterium endophyticum]